MNDIKISDALHMLTAEDPSYKELVSLYNELRRTALRTPESTVSRRALAQILGELIDYLEFIEAELEKSLGISRAAERERVLSSFEEPRGATPLERVSRLVQQWESFERYSFEDITMSVEK